MKKGTVTVKLMQVPHGRNPAEPQKSLHLDEKPLGNSLPAVLRSIMKDIHDKNEFK